MTLSDHNMQGALTRAAGVPADSQISAVDAAREGANFNRIQTSHVHDFVNSRDTGSRGIV